MTRWQTGDPAPEGNVHLRGRSGTCWWNSMGGWRHGGMAAYHAVPWDRALEQDGPFREIRLLGGKWLFADEMVEPAKELNAAVEWLDELLAGATTGTWTAAEDGLVWPTRMGDPVSGSSLVEDAQYIAAMGPQVGVPLLHMLRGMARWHEANGSVSWPAGTDNFRDLVRGILASKPQEVPS